MLPVSHRERSQRGKGSCLRNCPEYFNVGVWTFLERPCPRSVRRSISVVSPPPPSVRQGDHLPLRCGRRNKCSSLPHVRQPGGQKRAGAGHDARREGTKICSVGRTKEESGGHVSDASATRGESPNCPIAWARSPRLAGLAKGGTRPPRASNKDLGSRSLESLAGRSNTPGGRSAFSTSPQRFSSAPRESAFPPLR